MTSIENGMKLHRYWDLASCRVCPIKYRCTPSKERRIETSLRVLAYNMKRVIAILGVKPLIAAMQD